MKQFKLILALLLLLNFSPARADEGMWLPQLLAKLNEGRMKSLGMKISASDIYNINKGSLKDAIVSFGGFCTGEVISSIGLVLTNHHCGFDAIQNHSTLENNYIRDGFWAQNNAKEIPNAGLFVTFIVRIDDVTNAVMKGVTSSMTEAERQSRIDKNIDEVRKNATRESTQENMIRGFFEGNQYYMFTTETYRDVRLVGAPPSSIGNFGKDTDNWSWPRHTGDFSMFRIYASKDNKPADYSAENVPFRPKRALNISMDGIAEGDFTMVFGFPGATNQYLHSAAVKQIVDVLDPAKIDIREKAMGVIDGYMRRNEQVKIKYAAKYASLSNYWKKWSGEVLGLKRTNGVAKKEAYEKTFQERVNANPVWKNMYGNLLNDLAATYQEIQPFSLARDQFNEIMIRVEMYAITSNLNSLVTAFEKDGENGYNQRLAVVKKNLANIYDEYDENVDRDLFRELMPVYLSQPEKFVAREAMDAFRFTKSNYSDFASRMYNDSYFDEREKVEALLEKPSAAVVEEIKNSYAPKFFKAVLTNYQENVQRKMADVQARINKLQREYMKAQMEVMKEKTFYPDANRTMRVTFGQVKGYIPRDGARYEFSTDLDGVMEKYVPGDYEFDLPAKLIELHSKKDYGRYGKNGRMPVNFIATNHTTGGNSGSPALDAYGNLIGLNFDRVWEGTMSDINYDPSICRNIMVDIRYVLFIVDKFAGAKHLVDEMNLVYPKSKKKK